VGGPRRLPSAASIWLPSGRQVQLLARLAEVWADKLMDAEAALRCHQQILEIDPDHPISLKSMQKLYAEVQDWTLCQEPATPGGVLTEAEEQIRIHAAAGDLYAEELSDYGEAIAHWQKVVDLEPTHEGEPGPRRPVDGRRALGGARRHYRRQLRTRATPPARARSINGWVSSLARSWAARRRAHQLAGSAAHGREEPRCVARPARALFRARHVGGVRRHRAPHHPLTDPGEAKEVRFCWRRRSARTSSARRGRKNWHAKCGATEPHTADQMTLWPRCSRPSRRIRGVIALEKERRWPTSQVKVALYYEAARSRQ